MMRFLIQKHITTQHLSILLGILQFPNQLIFYLPEDLFPATSGYIPFFLISGNSFVEFALELLEKIFPLLAGVRNPSTIQHHGRRASLFQLPPSPPPPPLPHRRSPLLLSLIVAKNIMAPTPSKKKQRAALRKGTRDPRQFTVPRSSGTLQNSRGIRRGAHNTK